MTTHRTAETQAAIRRRSSLVPEVAIILGSGLGAVADQLRDSVAIDFADLPGFGTSTAAGHRGQLVLGLLEQTPVVALAGRLHRYGGWTTDEVTYPVRVMRQLGAERLIVSNAAGGVHPRLRVGDIVIIDDHLDWMAGRPELRWSGSHAYAPADEIAHCRSKVAVGGPLRSRLYDRAMQEAAMQAARDEGFTAVRGTYLAVLGPNYETRAEYRMMRRLGVDVVGMSTVPEVMCAASLGMSILALSMVSNVATPDTPQQANHDEVLAAGRQAEPRMTAIVRRVLK